MRDWDLDSSLGDSRFVHRSGVSEGANESLLVDTVLSGVASSTVVENMESHALVSTNSCVME